MLLRYHFEEISYIFDCVVGLFCVRECESLDGIENVSDYLNFSPRILGENRRELYFEAKLL